MQLYLENGYVNIRAIRELGLPFNFLVGGRGTGKTYGTLKDVILHGETFFLLRRRQKQINAIRNPAMSPFKKLNMDFGWNIVPSPIGEGVSGYYDMSGAEPDAKPSGLPCGYLAALSTIASIRGFDASDVSVIIYDEFIPEKHEQKLKEEYAAWANAYETINRNRELEGHPPVQMMCLANANTLANPIFEGLDLVGKCEQMMNSGQEISIMRDRGIGLFFLRDSGISKKKEETALYKLTRGSEFEDMSIRNEFVEAKDSTIVKRHLKEYTPLYTIGGITVYKHKSKGTYYVSEHCSGTPVEYGDGDREKKRFVTAHAKLYLSYITGKIEFESYKCLSIFNAIYA